MNTDEILPAPKHPGGRPPNKRRRYYMQKYGVHPFNARKILRELKMDQLDACKTEAARRILLGVSK